MWQYILNFDKQNSLKVQKAYFERFDVSTNEELKEKLRQLNWKELLEIEAELRNRPLRLGGWTDLEVRTDGRSALWTDPDGGPWYWLKLSGRSPSVEACKGSIIILALILSNQIAAMPANKLVVYSSSCKRLNIALNDVYRTIQESLKSILACF